MLRAKRESLGIKPCGPHPGGPALGNPRSCFNVNFNSYAHGWRSGTKVPLALFIVAVVFLIKVLTVEMSDSLRLLGAKGSLSVGIGLKIT